MTNRVPLVNTEGINIFQGDNMMVDDEFQPDENRIYYKNTELVIDEANSALSCQNQNEPLIFQAEVVDGGGRGTVYETKTIVCESDNVVLEDPQFLLLNSEDSEHDVIDNKEQIRLKTENYVHILSDQSILSNPDGECDSIEPRKVININIKADSSKPSVSGLNVAGGSSNIVRKYPKPTNFLCPIVNCKLKLPSKSSLLTHVKMCHNQVNPTGDELTNEHIIPDSSEIFPEDSDDDGTEIDTSSLKTMNPKTSRKYKIYECHHCGYVTDLGAASLRKHVKEMHEEVKQYSCSECGIKVSRKYHLIRHIKAVHNKEKFWQCEDCDYKTNNQVCFKKHKQNKHEGGGDCDLVYSVESLQNLPRGVTEADLKCVCTWCVFKSNKYSVVKKHIEIHHEKKRHYPCKECVFVGQSVDDYAEHYHTFHKTDSYPHACTDCSFKCTNKHDLKQHYSDTHSKQRLYVCKMCDHKSNDVNNIKRHINTVHGSARKVYRCELCNFESEQRLEFSNHQCRVASSHVYLDGVL